MTKPTFYRMCQDNSLAGRWLVDNPDITESDDDTWFDLKRGKYLAGRSPVKIEISKRGRAMDVSMTSLGNLVLSSRTAQLLEGLAPGEAQFLDADIDSAHIGYKVVNLLNHPDCLDPGLSDMLDPYPDGRLNILRVAIDSKAAGQRNIFRVATWPVAIVIAQRVRDRLEEQGATGATYSKLRSS